MHPFVSDSFTDTDATLLQNHVGERGATWTQHPVFPSGSMDIRSNTARTASSTAVYYASGTPYTADYDVQAVLVPLTVAARTGVYGRLDTIQHTGYAIIYNPTTGAWELSSILNNSSTLIGSFIQTLTANQSYTCKLKMRGTSIQVYIDGTQRIAATDANITSAGRAGLRGSQNAGISTSIHIDSITATDALITARPQLNNMLPATTLKVRVAGVWVVPNIYQVTTAGTSPWNGDYDTGDLSQWPGHQLTDAQSCTLVTSPRRKGSGFAARFQVDPGENAGIPPSDRDRAEVTGSVGTTQGIQGRECWYGWSTYFPNNTPSGEFLNPSTISNATNIFTQWHEPTPTFNVPPVRFGISNTGVMNAKIAGGGSFPNAGHVDTFTLNGSVPYNAWWDFVFHVVWSPDSSVGLVEIWAGPAGTLSVGSPTVPLTHMSTLYPAPWNTVYIKQGFYKDHNSPVDLQTIVYHDETRLGNSFAEVCPTGTPS